MSIIELKNIFNQLLGEWSVERKIQSPEGHGLFKGACVFTEMNDGRLLCEESGMMTLNGHTNEAKRSYIYAYQNDRIVILYNDPYRKDEVLHELTFEMQGDDYVATHCHLCGNDTYDLKFTLQPDSRIHMNYVVKGPHKDYAMQSILTRHVIL